MFERVYRTRLFFVMKRRSIVLCVLCNYWEYSILDNKKDFVIFVKHFGFIV